VENELAELESYLDQIHIKKESVSQATVGWQVNHVLQGINGVCLSLMKSKEEDYKNKFSLIKSYIFLVQKFPRGRAKSPKEVSPPDEVRKEAILKELSNAKRLLKKIENLPAKSHFKHGIFGILNLKESKKFLKIHTEHHLKIIRDILK
jgi:hypothetical protein